MDLIEDGTVIFTPKTITCYRCLRNMFQTRLNRYMIKDDSHVFYTQGLLEIHFPNVANTGAFNNNILNQLSHYQSMLTFIQMHKKQCLLYISE